MTKSLNETIGSCDFKIDSLNVLVGYTEDNLSFGFVFSEVEGCQARYDEECLSKEDMDELLQQKEFINSLFNEGGNLNRNEVVMFHEMKLVFYKDKKKLPYLNGQEKIVGHTSRAVTKVEDQNSILMKDAEMVSQDDWLGDKEEENNEDGSEVDMSQAKEEEVLELKKAKSFLENHEDIVHEEAELIIRINQEVEV